MTEPTSDADQMEIMQQVDDLFEYIEMCSHEGIDPSNVLAAMLIVVSMVNDNSGSGMVH